MHSKLGAVQLPVCSASVTPRSSRFRSPRRGSWRRGHERQLRSAEKCHFKRRDWAEMEGSRHQRY